MSTIRDNMSDVLLPDEKNQSPIPNLQSPIRNLQSLIRNPQPFPSLGRKNTPSHVGPLCRSYCYSQPLFSPVRVSWV